MLYNCKCKLLTDQVCGDGVSVKLRLDAQGLHNLPHPVSPKVNEHQRVIVWGGGEGGMREGREDSGKGKGE